MQCNIDAKGKAVRLVGGLIQVVAGVVVLGLAAGGVWTGRWGWIVGTVLLVGGGFQVFEGWAGWCVVRAMGIKTKV